MVGEAFPSTHWSALLPLKDPASRREGLSVLFQRYWRPAVSYVRNLRRCPPEEALDLTQEFFARMLEKGYFEQMEPGHGSFRGYLKTSLKNFCLNALRAEKARRPGEGTTVIRVEDGWDSLPASTGESPEEAFDRDWARGIVRESLGELKRALEKEGKPEMYAILAEYYDGDPLVATLAAKYKMAEHDITNRLRTARAMLRRIVKERVMEYLGPGDDPEQELMFLLSR
jgi:RNA polymerase sigma-70 factor (ECF subfamily)